MMDTSDDDSLPQVTRKLQLPAKFYQPSYRPTKRKRLITDYYDSSDYENSEPGLGKEDESDAGETTIVRTIPISAFEALPKEILQNIAFYVHSDRELRSLICTSKMLNVAISPNESTVWRRRFLSMYDFPFIEHSQDFAFAYKIRQLAFSNLTVFDRADERSEAQLQVLRSMVLETYNKSRTYESYAEESLNLTVITDPFKSPWIHMFLLTPFLSTKHNKHGVPHTLFDMLQVCLSHLVLVPRSVSGPFLSTTKKTFDIVRVYNFDLPLTTIFSVQHKSNPNLHTLNAGSNAAQPKSASVIADYHFDIHSVLHIRNFFAKHFAESRNPATFGEENYTNMLNGMIEYGLEPKAWTKPIYEPSKLSHEWMGRFHSMEPWPKTKKQLEARQVYPEEPVAMTSLLMRVETSQRNHKNSFWPVAFDTIGTLKMPKSGSRTLERYKPTFFRGLARRLGPQAGDNEDSVHPFKALRVRGYTHEIRASNLHAGSINPRNGKKPDPDQAIPGWKRLVMIMYQPLTYNLLQVLEHAVEDYGGSYQTQIGDLFNTANIWNDPNNSNVDSIPLMQAITIPPIPVDNIVQSSSTFQAALDADTITVNTENASSSSPPTTTVVPNNAQSDLLTPEQIQDRLDMLLDLRLKSFEDHYDQHPESLQSDEVPLFSPRHIFDLDTKFIPAEHLSFNTEMNQGAIGDAYAYEGTITPGGQIIMGRWWKVDGSEGRGPGCEVSEDGIGIEVRFKNETDKDGNITQPEQSGPWNWNLHDSGDTAYSSTREVEFITNDDDDDDDEDEADGQQEEEGITSTAKQGLSRGPFCFWAIPSP